MCARLFQHHVFCLYYPWEGYCAIWVTNFMFIFPNLRRKHICDRYGEGYCVVWVKNVLFIFPNLYSKHICDRYGARFWLRSDDRYGLNHGCRGKEETGEARSAYVLWTLLSHQEIGNWSFPAQWTRCDLTFQNASIIAYRGADIFILSELV